LCTGGRSLATYPLGTQGFHALLRHTFARLIFENKEQLKLVSEMLGHASVRQTADTYTHVSPTMHREAAMRLNDFLSGHLK
jgi:integrase